MKQTTYAVGELVKLSDYGHDIFKSEWAGENVPAVGDTAIVKEVVSIGVHTSPEYVVEFFCYPGRVWGCYYGEIVAV